MWIVCLELSDSVDIQLRLSNVDNFKLSKEEQLKPFAHINHTNLRYIKQLGKGPESCVRCAKSF